MTNNKPAVLIVGAIGALLALSLMLRFVLLSQFGLPGGGFLYFGLPVGGISVLMLLLRLGLLHFGETSRPTIQHWQQPSPESPTTRRLQELDSLHASGALSDVEYAAERTRIIAGV
jgi:amino acid transporter